MDALIGRQIRRLFVNADQSVLAFDTDAGVIAYEGYGDCCSETWFADITGADALIGGTVSAVEAVAMGDVTDGRTRQEVDTIYGAKLTTDKGRADIVYRNSSNGYYGGSADLMGDAPGLDGMTEITDDWSA